MWLSKKLSLQRAAEQEGAAADMGVTTIGGGSASVVTRGEQRDLAVFAPGGLVWQPKCGDTVLVIKGGVGCQESCVAAADTGANAPKDMAPGELYLYSDGGASVYLRSDGSIEIKGPASGSGKTTLLRCLNFLERPDSGIIRVNGEVLLDAGNPSPDPDSVIRRKRLHFGLVFQSFNLFPQYTALENVMLAKELLAKEQPDYKARKKEIHEEIRVLAEELLEQMGLKNRMSNYPHQLSGGQCQRVAIARALALKPDILCFDEPTSALDPELTGEVLRVIKELADQQTTMVIVTHEMAFARDVAHHVIFMDDGYILEQGTPEEVFGNTREERTRQFLSRFNQG